MNGNKNLETQLKERINEAEEEKRKLENQISELESGIKNMRETLQFLFKKTGKINQMGRFANMKLGKALDILIKEYGTVTPEKLIEELEANGYVFKGKRKPQTIKFTVWNKKWIDHTEDGVYKWKENVAGKEI